jgi:hypothetical protein
MRKNFKVDGKNDAILVKHVLLAEWCGVSVEVMRRTLGKFGLPSASPIDLRDLVGAMIGLIRSKEKQILSLESHQDELDRIAQQIEIETSRQKLEQLRAKTGILKREWVRVSDVQERTAALSRAMRTAGEQLGHRFGPDAQEIFNDAITTGCGALLSIGSQAETVETAMQEAADTVGEEVPEPEAKPAKRGRGRPRKNREVQA